MGLDEILSKSEIDVNDIIAIFMNQASYEGTLSNSRVEKTERKHTYIVKLTHSVASISYGFDSDRYLSQKKRMMANAKDAFEKLLREENYDFKRVENNGFKVKKVRNEKFK